LSKKIAIIGYGSVGECHGKAFREAGAEVVAAVGRSQETKARVHDEFSIPVFDNAVDLFEKIPLDAVVISSPTYTHCDYAIQAVQNGCYVLCEKPMATHRDDARRMWEASVQYDRCLMLALNLRYREHSRIAFNICKRGQLGHIYHAKCEWIRARGIPGLGKWFTTKEQSGGGVVIDAGIRREGGENFLRLQKVQKWKNILVK